VQLATTVKKEQGEKMKKKEQKSSSVDKPFQVNTTLPPGVFGMPEKEALACVHACEHFRHYLIGAEFDLIKDQRPLQTLFGNPRTKLPARIEHFSDRQRLTCQSGVGVAGIWF